MSNIHFFVHGRGRGHATRSRAVIERLGQAGHALTVFCGRDAQPALAEDYATRPITCLMPDTGWRTPAVLGARVLQDRRTLRRERADIVISDGDLPSLVAARLAGIPSIAIGHGLMFWCCHRPAWLPRGAWQREAFKARWLCRAADRRIAVNFMPIPVRRGRLVRPTLDLPPGYRWERGHRLLCYFRDAVPAALLRELAGLGLPLVLFSATDPGMPGIDWKRPSRSEFLEALRDARAVVSSAGSQVISECVALGVPIFGVHAPGDDEQRLNVAMLRHAGLGDGCETGQVTREGLTDFLGRPLPDRPDWREVDLVDAVLRESAALLAAGKDPQRHGVS